MAKFKVTIDDSEYEVEADTQQEADAFARQAHGNLDVGQDTQITTPEVQVTAKRPTPEEQAAFEAEQAKEPTVMQKALDIVTGDLRKVPSTESLEDWKSMPELNQLDLDSAVAFLSTAATGKNETMGIVKNLFPDVEVSEDEKGNPIFKSAIDGKSYAFKPGFRTSDIPRAITSVAEFIPAGRVAGGVAKMAAAGAATQGAIEGVESSAGGEFNPENVGLAGVIPGGVKALGGLAEGAGNIVNAIRNRITGGAKGVPVPEEIITQQAPPVAMSLEDISATAKQAGEGSKSATQEIATQVMPDAEKIEAAKRLGIEEFLQPDHVTTNQVYRELAQAVKSYPGSIARAEELNGLKKITERVDDMLVKLGADDVSVISDVAKKDLLALHDKTFSEAGKLFEEIRAAIPAKTQVNPENVINAIKARADELGGVENLSSAEKTVLKKLSPKEDGTLPTYALLDDVRKSIVEAKYGKGEEAFSNASDRILDILNTNLRQDQKAVADQFRMADTFELAQKTSATYKAMQDDLKALFGKNMADSIVGDISTSTRALAEGDTSKFIKLLGAIKYLPKQQQQEIVASGLNTAFGQRIAGGQMNFGAYAKWYNKLKTQKQAYTALMTNLPAGTAKQLNDLAKVSEGIAASSRERIQTGRINVVNDIVKNADTAIGKMYEAVKDSSGRMAFGAVADLVGTGGAGMAFALGSALTKNKTPAMKAVDSVITSQPFIKAATNPSPENVRMLAKDARFIEFMKKITDNSTLSERERFILTTIQAEKPKD